MEDRRRLRLGKLWAGGLGPQGVNLSMINLGTVSELVIKDISAVIPGQATLMIRRWTILISS